MRWSTWPRPRAPTGSSRSTRAGNATLRAAEATDGILVYAADAGKATFGADDGAPITNAYYGATAVGSGVSCGCGLPVPDGLQVYSEDGDASVNVYSLTNPIALVASGNSVRRPSPCRPAI